MKSNSLTPAQLEMDRQNSEDWDRVYFAHLKHAERLNAVALLDAVGSIVRARVPTPAPKVAWVFDDEQDRLQTLHEEADQKRIEELERVEFERVTDEMAESFGGRDE